MHHGGVSAWKYRCVWHGATVVTPPVAPAKAGKYPNFVYNGGPGVNTRRLLVEEGGFLYDSDAYDDELPYWVRVNGQPHLVVPYSLSTNDSKFGRGVFATGDDFFHYCRDAFDFLYQEGRSQPKMLSIGLHMRLIGHPARAARPAP